MDKNYILVIIALLGFLQTIFMFIVGYLFKINGTLFEKMDKNKADCLARIDKNAEQDKQDKAELENKMISLLDKHYVTTGQLNTLEQELKGEIKGLTTAIHTLTQVIQEKL